MKRTLLMTMLCALCATSMTAQTTKVIKGAVIDKNGNPLPGAVVEATGGAENTTTDADGSFEMEVPLWLKSITAKYAGMSDRKLKLRDGKNSNLILKMKPYCPNGWFVSLVGSVNSNYEYRNEKNEDRAYYYRMGIMGGHLGNWGFYGKIMPTIAEGTDGTPAVTIGGIKHLTKGTFAFLGAGYAPLPYRRFDYDYYYNVGYEIIDGPDHGIMCDLGVIVTLKSRFVVTCGLNITLYSEHTFDREIEKGAFVGIGYKF